MSRVRQIGVGIFVAAILAAVNAAAQDKPLSGTFSMVTLPPGTTFNATAAGIAKLFNEYTGARMRLREAGATMEVYISRKETDFGLSSAPNAWDAWNGIDAYKGNPMKNLRNVLIGPVLYGGIVVTTASQMRTVADLKGKRVPGRFNAMPTFLDDINVYLAGGGITWKDVREIPVAGIRENNQSFFDGLTDAMNASVGSGVVSQADAKHRGVRFLTMPINDPDVQKRMNAVKQGFYPVVLQKGSFTGIIEDTMVWAKDIQVNVHDGVPDEVVYQFFKVFWNHVRELDKTHPAMPTWTQDGMASTRNTLPRHPGAIRFLKEVGRWTAANEARDKELYALK